MYGMYVFLHSKPFAKVIGRQAIAKSCSNVTLPEVLTPFEMQANTIIHARSKHRQRSHLIFPGLSIPSDIFRTLFLKCKFQYDNSLETLISVWYGYGGKRMAQKQQKRNVP